ncbi:hypothetical protein JAAARDRAFT_92179, partial [Jaapia argillacea MUCL 33604]
VTHHTSNKPSILNKQEDTEGNAAAIDNKWRIIGRLQIGKKLGDGKSVRCNPNVICVGDFVDVGVTMDVVSHPHWRDHRSSIYVHLTLSHILQ